VEAEEGAGGVGGGGANDPAGAKVIRQWPFKAWAQAFHRGYEGIVAKDPQSPYVPGRTLKWIKVKQNDYRKEARGFHRE